MTPLANDEIIIGVADLKRLFRKLRSQLIGVVILGAMIAFCLLSVREPKYVAQASFKQTSNTGDSGLRLKDLFQGVATGGGDSGAASVMQSRTILRSVVEKLGLQIQCTDQLWLTQVIHTVIDNLYAECGKEISPLHSFRFEKVAYEVETATVFYIKPVDALSFEVFDARKQLVGRWNLDQPFSFANVRATLTDFPKGVRYHKLYQMTLFPWEAAVESVRKSFEVKPFKLDRNILGLTFLHRDRFLAALFLNQVMATYQQFLHTENEELIGTQRNYLDKRQQELTQSWDESLQEHVCYLKSNLNTGGYFSLYQEMEMLSQPRKLFTSKLFDVDLELKRLQGMPMDQVVMNRADRGKDVFLSKRGALTAQGPQEIHLKKNHKGVAAQAGSNAFITPLEEKKAEWEGDLFAVDLEHQRLVSQGGAQLFGGWLTTGGPSEEYDQEFAGLTLENAQSLYLNYNTIRDAEQAQLRQLIYLLDELSNPNFELSSITTILSDPVTLDLVGKASDTAILLKDAHNRSPREQEHLRNALDNQKRFIKTHLKQTIDLITLRTRLIEDKILSLQKTTMGLLIQEKGLIKEKLEEINEEMEDLPEKWRRENLLMLKKEMGMHMIEGLTQLAESKNIEQNLFQASSKALDRATIPVLPKAPRLVLFSIIAAFLAAGATYFFHLCKALLQGMPVSHDTLLLCGYRSLGKLSLYCGGLLSELVEHDIETLRRICQLITTSHAKPVTVALIGGKNPDYSHNLAELLSLQGSKVLVIHYVFDAVHAHEVPGLWHYLHDEVTTLPIRHHGAYDYLPSGSTSFHSVELLRHPKFQALLSYVKTRYDTVLIYSKALPQFAEAHALLSNVDVAVVTTCEEKRQELSAYLEWESTRQNVSAAFVCCEDRR